MISERFTRTDAIYLGAIAAAGILMRFFDIGYIDLIGDEAQYILGTTHVHPPLTIKGMQMIMDIFGHETVVARGVNMILGIVSIGLIGLLARELTHDKKTIILSIALASILPSHIIFTRLMYLDIAMTCGWLVFALLYVYYDKKPTPALLLGLFITSMLLTFTKTQAFLPVMFVGLHRIWKLRTGVLKDQLFWILAVSGLPFVFYVFTHPEILATTLANSQTNVFGIGPKRLFAMVATWQRYAPFFWMFLLPAAVYNIRKIGPALASCIIAGLFINFFLGADHKYYTLYFVLSAIPAAMLFVRLPRIALVPLMAALLFIGFQKAGPAALTNSYFAEMGETNRYWIAHEEEINAVLQKENIEHVIVYPIAKHQHRWYLKPEVLSADYMPKDTQKGIIFIERLDYAKDWAGSPVLYEDERSMIVRAQ